MYKAEILRSSREREKKLKNTKRLLGLLVVIVIVGSFIFLLNLNFFRLTVIELSGETSQDLGMIKGSIITNLDGYCLGLVPNNSVFFFSKTKLTSLLRKRFPSLQSIEINSPNLNTLAVKVVDRESKVLWCTTGVKNKPCFYLNDEGQVYQVAPNFSEAIIMEFDSPIIIKKLPTTVINPQDLDRAKNFLNFLKASLVNWPSVSDSNQVSTKLAFKVIYTNVLPLKDFEAVIGLTNDSADRWRVFFNTGISSEELITNLHSLIKDPTLTKDWRRDKSLDYLDLRFDNKVFYRFK